MLKFANGILAALTLAAAPHAATYAAYPERPITLVVPSVPGGAADAVGRLVGEGLAKQLNVPVIVENRPGGAGIIGTQAVIKAAPDGYTVLLGLDATLSSVPYLMEKQPYDPLKDLTPVATLSTLKYVLVASPKAPFRSVAQMLEQARARPDSITYASGGEGSTHHLAMELFQKAAGVTFRHVPYKAAPQGFVDVMGGHIDMMFIAAGTAISPVKANKVQGLANSSTTPIPDLPDLPLLKDIVKGFTFDSWFGLFTPAGTPAAVVNRLESALAVVLKSPEVEQKMQAQGLVPGNEGADGLRRRMSNDQNIYAPILARIKAQGGGQP